MYDTGTDLTGRDFQTTQINLKFFESHDSFNFCYNSLV